MLVNKPFMISWWHTKSCIATLLRQLHLETMRLYSRIDTLTTQYYQHLSYPSINIRTVACCSLVDFNSCRSLSALCEKEVTERLYVGWRYMKTIHGIHQGNNTVYAITNLRELVSLFDQILLALCHLGLAQNEGRRHADADSYQKPCGQGGNRISMTLARTLS